MNQTRTLVEMGDVYEKTVIEEKKTKKISDPKAKFGIKTGKGGIQAFEQVKDKKPVLEPNPNFFAYVSSAVMPKPF